MGTTAISTLFRIFSLTFFITMRACTNRARVPLLSTISYDVTILLAFIAASYERYICSCLKRQVTYFNPRWNFFYRATITQNYCCIWFFFTRRIAFIDATYLYRSCFFGYCSVVHVLWHPSDDDPLMSRLSCFLLLSSLWVGQRCDDRDISKLCWTQYSLSLLIRDACDVPRHSIRTTAPNDFSMFRLTVKGLRAVSLTDSPLT